MQHFPGLAQLQSLLWKLLTAPEGVAKGAEALHRNGELESRDLGFLIEPDPRLGPTERLDVYADMYFYRLRDALAEDFPKLAASLGDVRFHNLVTDYLLAHPSSHFSLRELGRALPGFLSTHALATPDPWLADLARLEWARVDVFDETDETPLSRDGLLAGAGTAPDAFALKLLPSVRLLSLDRCVLPVWLKLEQAGSDSGTRTAGGPAPETSAENAAGTEPASETSTGIAAAAGTAAETGAAAGSGTGPAGGVRVWRKGFALYHASMAPDEAGCLEAMAAAPVTLAELGERLLEAQSADTPPEQAAARLAELLARWSDDEILGAAPPS